jgi:branched-chain amino acid transport system substrate-binding protein
MNLQSNPYLPDRLLPVFFDETHDGELAAILDSSGGGETLVKHYDSWIGKILSIIGVIAMILTGLSACSQQSNTTNTQNQSPITIGVSISYTGDFSTPSKAMLQGYQLWVDNINKNGGLLGRQVKLVVLNDNSDPNQVTTDYQKLITQDKVDLLIGPDSSLLTYPAAVVAHRYGYALLEGAGGAPRIFGLKFSDVYDVSVPIIRNLDSFVDFILSLPANERPKTAAYATEDDPFTQPQVDRARQLLEQGGVKTAYYRVYPSETTDYTPIAQAMIQAKAQVVVMGTITADCAAFINAFKQQHYNPQAIVATAGPDQGSAFTKAIGGTQSAEGVFVPNGWYPQLNAFQNSDFIKAYTTKYGGTPDDIAADTAEGYSVGQVLQQAVTKIHSIDNAALNKELHSDTFAMVQGPVKFDAVGENVAAVTYLFQWQSGHLVPVFPSSAASNNPQFPKANWPS